VVLLFSVEDDKKLGKQVSEQIASDPSYKILSRSQYAQAYQYLDQVVDEILNSGEVVYKDDFVWEVYLLEDDSTLNAFATPGGYIYVYTGLIKYLDNVDALAGVLGHEIAHADLRHSSRTMQKQYGVSVLLGILLGNNENQLIEIAGQMAGQVAGLSFSREYETESDLRSVEYLAQTPYACDGAKIFFQKLENAGQGGTTPQFFSTHPSPVNRIQNIEDKASEENCDTQLLANSGYTAFKAMLP
jgi:predicted Zn-dependent protease